MGQIDVSDIVNDADFTDPMTLIHRLATVNDKGENVLVNQAEICTFGVIQPASGKAIQRLPEAMRVANISTFWLKATIKPDGNGLYSDIIVYKGQRYAVQTVLDYTNWGQGWTEGTCVMEKPTL